MRRHNSRIRRSVPRIMPLFRYSFEKYCPGVRLSPGRSASASEILTGALKDNCRATVAGSRTYGKGLIQSVYELSDGSGLVLTVGKYVTPGLNDIDRQGIQPDFAMFPGFAKAQEELSACEVPTNPSARR